MSNKALALDIKEVKIKAEPGEPVDEPLPALPSLPSLDSIPNKGVLNNLLGEIFITHVEAPKSRNELVHIEIANYMSEVNILLNQSPLVWWKEHEFRYLILSRLAKQVLCIPATSVPSERVFSTAGDS